jgi:hypothetical protein
MTIDNLDIILPLLQWTDPNDFYFCQILKRKKENPDNTSNSSVIATYYIGSLEKKKKKYDEMKLLSEFHNARVYINLNKRNYERLGLQMMKKVCDCLQNKDYKSIRRAYDSICGTYNAENEKKWIVDLDNDKCDSIFIEHIITGIDFNISGQIYGRIPTLNGHHLITSPFNTQIFTKYVWEHCGKITIDIQKDNPTLLYYNSK